jgi:hypothetical protein
VPGAQLARKYSTLPPVSPAALECKFLLFCDCVVFLIFFFFFFFSFFDDYLSVCVVSVGRKLAVLAKKATAGSTVVTFKTDQKMWGVTGAADERLTLHSFGDYKSPTRLAAEVALSDYLNNFSKPRYLGGKQTFGIAVAVAAPGTGKSRMVDDTVRGLIAAKVQDGKPTKFFDPSDKLLLAITFNGGTTTACQNDVASRCVLEFFCGQPKYYKRDGRTGGQGTADSELSTIDYELSRLVSGAPGTVEMAVLDALEALFFDARGGSLGRSVVLVDEMSKALNEDVVYRAVRSWVDAEVVDAASGLLGRRGAVFTGLSVLSPWTKESLSGRLITPLALGLFDVFSPEGRKAVQLQAKIELSDKMLHLLASTGGRPRDIEAILGSIRSAMDEMDLLTVFEAVKTDSAFKTYLLPSMLGLLFTPEQRTVATLFGRDIASPALLNADPLTAANKPSVPAVSLRFWRTLEEGSLLCDVFKRLVRCTTFRSLDKSGKDFERVCVLLLHAHLLLQHRVRCDVDGLRFWPQGSFTDIGGDVMPTGAALDVFSRTRAREKSLFAVLAPSRVFEAPGSTIRRKIVLEPTVEPSVMLWHDLWTPDVCGGSEDTSLMATTDVAWQSPSLVYFTRSNHEAIDFMLLVGKRGGSGVSKPHVYMFQCKAARRDSVAATLLQQIVDDLDVKLDVVFSDAFERHVLRRAGIKSKRQVTLCVAAVKIGDNFTFDSYDADADQKKTLITPPFNVVLFDCAAIADLGGAAFRPTFFMHDLADKLARNPETFRFELAAIPIIQRSMYMQKEASNCPRVNRGSRRRAGTPRPVARARSSRHCSIRIGRNSFANSSIYACNTNCNCPQTILTTRQRARSNGV